MRHTRPLFIVAFGLSLLSLVVPLAAQEAFLIPNQTKVKDMQRVLNSHPEAFALQMHFTGQDSTLALQHLDLLDSAYRIAFDIDNPRLYTLRIEAYGTADSLLWLSRAQAVYRYFAGRSHTPFPVRYVHNPIHCFCHGDTMETVRYEVPVSTAVYDCAQLPDSRKIVNKTVALDNSILITFRHNPEECFGLTRGTYLPTQDSTILGAVASLILSRGSVYSLHNSMDSVPRPLRITLDEHFDYKKIVENYALVPHRRQIIVQTGYVVIRSNYNYDADSCQQPLPDSIFVRIPITEEQWADKLRAFAKKPTAKGMEYKSLPTRKIKTKNSTLLRAQTAINATQFDTIYFGKRIKPEELKDYFYEIDSDREVGSFTINGRHYKAYVVGTDGEYEMKKKLRNLFRIIEEAEDDFDTPDDPNAPADDEEIIED